MCKLTCILALHTKAGAMRLSNHLISEARLTAHRLLVVFLIPQICLLL